MWPSLFLSLFVAPCCSVTVLRPASMAFSLLVPTWFRCLHLLLSAVPPLRVRLLGGDVTVGRLASPIPGTAFVAIFAQASLSYRCISKMSLMCYACTHPSSTTPPRKFFDNPEASALAMHTACFMDFTGYMETQATLLQLLINWRFISRCNIQHRRRGVLTLVVRWQRNQWKAWVEHLQCRFLCRRFLSMWEQVAIGMPNLVDSNSDDEAIGVCVSASSH
jgi:hypothetical protein